MVVEALIARGVAINPLDRWGNSPLDDASRGGHVAVMAVLQSADGREGKAIRS